MSDYFRYIPFGSPLPIENPHAVSVSLPLLQNVIDYEEGNESAIAQMQSGYPRFFQNKLVEKLVNCIRLKYSIPIEKTILPIASLHAKSILEKLLNFSFEFIEEDGNVFLVLENDLEFIKKCNEYIRNIGLLISSRKAESTLYKLNEITKLYEEDKCTDSPEKQIKHILKKAYSLHSDSSIILSNSGMNALFSAYKTIVNSPLSINKNGVIQLGWLYVDTMEIIEKQSQNFHIQITIHDKESLENWMVEHHSDVALLITEVVTNPLIQCVDLPWLSSLCRKYNIVLVVDSTLATPFNVHVLPYCDIVVESLTKFACGHGDLLMGALLLNEESKIYTFKKQFEKFIIPPYLGELQRLAHQIQNYEERVEKIAKNTLKLYHYLKNQPYIREVFTALHPDSFENYLKIKKNNHAFPGILSVVFKEGLAISYDKLQIAKGPSLGTEFTIAMPYVYLAHYNYLKNDIGKKKLGSLGIDPDLLRISVGIEPIEDIIFAFEALNK